MLTTIEGVWRNGGIELTRPPENVGEETQVIVTFLATKSIDLEAAGISREEAAELRARFAAFAPDWDAPEMDIYDDYDAAKSRVSLPEFLE